MFNFAHCASKVLCSSVFFSRFNSQSLASLQLLPWWYTLPQSFLVQDSTGHPTFGQWKYGSLSSSVDRNPKAWQPAHVRFSWSPDEREIMLLVRNECVCVYVCMCLCFVFVCVCV
jgi:hypothetical protein